VLKPIEEKIEDLDNGYGDEDEETSSDNDIDR